LILELRFRRAALGAYQDQIGIEALTHSGQMYDRWVMGVLGQNPLAADQQSSRQCDQPNASGRRHPPPEKHGFR
jgi:hypothetical protein